MLALDIYLTASLLTFSDDHAYSVRGNLDAIVDLVASASASASATSTGAAVWIKGLTPGVLLE